MERLARGDVRDLVQALVDETDQVWDISALVRASGIAEEPLRALLAALPGVVGDATGSFWANARLLDATADRIRARLADHHREHPLLPGMEREQLRQEVARRWPPRAWAWVLGQVPDVAVDREWVRLVVFHPQPDDATVQLYHAIEGDGLRPRPLDDHRAQWIGAPLWFHDAIQLLLYRGQIYRLEDHYFIGDQAYQRGVEQVRQAIAEGFASTAELRAALGTNRRFAVSFLELLDSRHVTRRVGDRRALVPSAGATEWTHAD
jgi:selenocysteine-specific elongation factor